MLMKRTVIITLLLCSFFHVAALAVTSHTSIATSTAGFYVVEGMGREVWSMNPGWLLHRGDLEDGGALNVDDSQWTRVSLPNGIEHASFQDGGTHHPEFIRFSETIRSYDVNNQIAQAQTLQRLHDLGEQPDCELDGWGIINCEDEPYIAAGLGCAIGVMRHPYVGNLPNGKQDVYFADLGPQSRRLKNRLNEIVRAVRWHRIALPFGHRHDQWHADSVLLSESGGART